MRSFQNRIVWPLLIGAGVCLFFCISHLFSFCVHSYTVLQDEKQAVDKLFRQTGRTKLDRINESSGVAFSGLQPDSIWTINDSGHDSELFALSLTGETIVALPVGNAKNIDWEAMSSFRQQSRSFLLIADVGDNGFKRKDCQLYYLPEPDAKVLAANLRRAGKPPPVKATRVDFVYEDGPRNCEAAAVNPRTNECWLIEKVYYDSQQRELPGIYVLPFLNAQQKSLVAKRVGSFPVRNVTGMAFSPDGNRLIVRNYVHAHLYTRVEESSWVATIKNSEPLPVPLPLQRQGEAICFTPDSKSLIVTSEAKRQAIWQIDLEQYLIQQAQAREEPPGSTQSEAARDQLSGG